MNLGRFPRIRFAHLPTPLEHLANLSRALNGPEIWIKRDDCTGMSTGGNKTRKLEFLLAEARDRNADVVLTQGATQSNHARQTAACAAKLSLACHVLLEDRTGKKNRDYTQNGNVFLDLLHGAGVEHCAPNPDMNAELDKAAARMRDEGRRPYVIPGGGSNPTGAVGYVNAALELVTQANDLGLRIDHVVHATGSAGTQAGLVAGLAGMRSGVPLLGIGVRAPKQQQEEVVYRLACATSQICGSSGAVAREQVVANCDYVGTGYGFSTPASIEARAIAGSLPAQSLAAIAGELAGESDILLIACTELSVISANGAGAVPLLDSLDVLAQAIVDFANSPSPTARAA